MFYFYKTKVDMKKTTGIKLFILQEIIWMLFVSVLTSVFVVLLFHLYEIDLNTMISVQEDSIGVATLAHNYIVQIKQGNGLIVLKDILFSKEINFSLLHQIGLFICCFFFESFGTAVNFYYFVGYIMVALGMYCAVRILNKERWIAVIAGIIYTFLPYHYMRGESHIYLACYYMIPLGAAVIVKLMDVNAIYGKPQYLFFIFVSLLFGITDVYYSVFYVIILFLVFIVRLFNGKKIKEVFSIGFLIISPFLIFIIDNLYYFMSSHNSAINTLVVSDKTNGRSLSDLQIYGLKIIQLIIPIQNHRIKILSDFRTNIDGYLSGSESSMSSLGLLLTIGFVLSLFFVFVCLQKNETIDRLKIYGILNLYIIVVACVGGLNMLIGLVSSNIRCYNRMSVFIAAFALMFLVEVVQIWWDKYSEKKQYQTIIFIFSICIMLFSVWDQTVKFSKEEYLANWSLNHNTKQIVEVIDMLTEDKTKILMLPILNENPGMAINKMRNYEQSWNRVYSDNLKWIDGFDKDYANLLRGLSFYPLDYILQYLSVTDIDGIWLDQNGYSDSEFIKVKEILDEQLGEPLIVSESGKQFYYTLEPFKEWMKQNYKGEYLEELKIQNEILNNATGSYYGINSILVDGGIKDTDYKEIVLNKGNIQYGPYISLDEGKYDLEIHGDNLDNANLILMYDCGKESVSYETIKKEKTIWKLRYKIEQPISNFEFYMVNPKEAPVSLYYYYMDIVK